jgi:phage-related minor tail protein
MLRVIPAIFLISAVSISSAQAFINDAKCYLSCTASVCGKNKGKFESCRKNCSPKVLTNCMKAAAKAGFLSNDEVSSSENPALQKIRKCITNLKQAQTEFAKFAKKADAQQKAKINTIKGKMTDLEQTAEGIARKLQAHPSASLSRIDEFSQMCDELVQKNLADLKKLF